MTVDRDSLPEELFDPRLFGNTDVLRLERVSARLTLLEKVTNSDLFAVRTWFQTMMYSDLSPTTHVLFLDSALKTEESVEWGSIAPQILLFIVVIVNGNLPRRPHSLEHGVTEPKTRDRIGSYWLGPERF